MTITKIENLHIVHT